ncbi:MAG TPA: Holliday junction branch migration DNA helicase RuvB [Chitinivibrionales bacterium]|jgi:Holliday junction DNA helicase RuvB|nr:Holliday junction branch migration DNA helicase RuvB [Chitinivibrionales bacterium]
MDPVEKGNGSRIVSATTRDDDESGDATLRPQRFADFVGQEKEKENIALFVEAAKKRNEALDHILFTGPPGLGKTTLSRILANELGVKITTTSGPVLEKPGDLAGHLTNLADRDLLFIDEVHRLPHVVEEFLYPAMEDFVFDIMLGEGPSAQSVRLNLKHFTLVGATTRQGMLTAPMLGRFGYVCHLGYYSAKELQTIALRSAGILGVKCDQDAALELGRRARGTPRVVNRLLRRCRDVAEVKGAGRVNTEVVKKTLSMLGIDPEGLDEIDRKILLSIVEHYGGGPVGLNTIAVVVGEEPETIEEVYEPFLIQNGFLKRTSRGREVTPRVYSYFNLDPKKYAGPQGNLFQGD